MNVTSRKVRDNLMENIQLFGLKMRQRLQQDSPVFFVFYAPARMIAKWTGVERTKDRPGSIQRSLRDSRLAGIKRFLKADSKNTLPNNILIAFDQDMVQYTPIAGNNLDFSNECATSIEYGKICFSFDPQATDFKKPAVVVDGQHRLFGATSFPDEDLPLLVVAMLNASSSEQAFQFIVINNKAVRVPTTTVKSIVADYEDIEEGLIERLLPAGITYGKHSGFLVAIGEGEGSPFEGLLDWERNRTGTKLVAVTAIQSMVQYLKIQTELMIERDEDSVQQIFTWIWSSLKIVYPGLWNSNNVQFFSKVNLLAMNEYCVDRIRSLASMQMLNLFCEENVVNAAKTAFQNIPEELWTIEWTGIRIQDNRVVRDLLKSTFEKVSANCIRDKSWNLELKIFADSE